MPDRRRHAERSFRLLTVLALVLCVAPASGQPQEESSEGRSVVVRMGLRFESWTEDRSGPDGDALEQTGAYTSATVRLNPSLKLDLVTGWTQSQWGSGEDLAGLNDSKAQLSWRAGQQLVLRLGANLPTGQRNLSSEEVRIARGLADPTKAFSVNKVGEGFDVHVAAARSARLGTSYVAMAVSYLLKGGYEAVDGQGQYRPGNQLNVAVSLDREMGSMLWRSSVVFSTYGTDRLEEVDTFRFGNRWRVESLVRGGRAPMWQARGRAIFQGVNTSPGELDLAARSEEQGAGWYLDGSVGFPVSPVWSVHGQAGMRVIENDADGTGGGRRFDVGPAVRISVSSSAELNAHARYSLGKLEAGPQLSDIDLNGFGMDVNLVFWKR